MGEYNAYRDYEKNRSESAEVNADIYGRINVSSLNNSCDDSGEFVSERRDDGDISFAPKQKIKARPQAQKRSRPAGQRSVGSVDGERIVDIVCILITVVGLVLIALNFNAVLDAIMQVLYPIIQIVLQIVGLVILGVIAWYAIRRALRRFRI